MSAGAAHVPSAPPTASQRAYLRAGLPTLYREPDSFAMRFVGGLEEVLDPDVAMLDNLHFHLDPQLAPPALLHAIASWLGLRIDEIVGLAERRELVRRAIDLAPEFADEEGRRDRRGTKGGTVRQRGTKGGLELVLRLSFPDLEFSVKDDGAATAGADPDELPVASPRSFTVSLPAGIDDRRRRAIDRIVADVTPVGVTYHSQAPGEAKT